MVDFAKMKLELVTGSAKSNRGPVTPALLEWIQVGIIWDYQQATPRKSLFTVYLGELNLFVLCALLGREHQRVLPKAQLAQLVLTGD